MYMIYSIILCTYTDQESQRSRAYSSQYFHVCKLKKSFLQVPVLPTPGVEKKCYHYNKSAITLRVKND